MLRFEATRLDVENERMPVNRTTMVHTALEPLIVNIP